MTISANDANYNQVPQTAKSHKRAEKAVTYGEELGPAPSPASETAVGYHLEEELEEEEESLTARAEVHWDEASTDGEESEEELEMTEGEDNVELSGNSGFYCAMTGNVVPLIE